MQKTAPISGCGIGAGNLFQQRNSAWFILGDRTSVGLMFGRFLMAKIGKKCVWIQTHAILVESVPVSSMQLSQ